MPNIDSEKQIVWSPAFTVGVKVIDDQHKSLLDLVNSMFTHVAGDDKSEQAYFKAIVQQAVQYTKVHFATEEKIMAATEFPGYTEHKKHHDDFVLAVVQNARDFEAGKRLTLTKFSYFLKEWILTHIAVMDKQYFEYFKKIATRKADGTWSITSADVLSGGGG